MNSGISGIVRRDDQPPRSSRRLSDDHDHVDRHDHGQAAAGEDRARSSRRARRCRASRASPARRCAAHARCPGPDRQRVPAARRAARTSLSGGPAGRELGPPRHRGARQHDAEQRQQRSAQLAQALRVGERAAHHVREQPRLSDDQQRGERAKRDRQEQEAPRGARITQQALVDGPHAQIMTESPCPTCRPSSGACMRPWRAGGDGLEGSGRRPHRIAQQPEGRPVARRLIARCAPSAW